MFGSRPPQKSRRGKFWDWINPALGKSVNGWLAGAVVGVETHYMGHTQPCRFAITGGRMKCYCQTGNLASVWKGYVPLWDENGVQAFAIVGERFADLAYSIVMFAPVAVTRLKSAGSPVCVKQSDWTDQPPALKDAAKLRPVDLRPWLLKLWGDKSLVEWFDAHPEAATEAEAAKLNAEGFSPMLQAAARRASGDGRLPPTVAEVLPQVVSRNGKGHK